MYRCSWRGMANICRDSYSYLWVEKLKTPAQIWIYSSGLCWAKEDGVEETSYYKYLFLFRHPCQPSSHSPALSPTSGSCFGDAWHNTTKQYQMWPPWTFAPLLISLKVFECLLTAMWLYTIGLSDTAVPKARGSPGSAGLPRNRGHQVVQSHCSASGAICPPGHQHGGSWMRQQVLAARAIPRCCWQLVWGTGLCPDGPRFRGTALRDQNWTHPSHVSAESSFFSHIPSIVLPSPAISLPVSSLTMPPHHHVGWQPSPAPPNLHRLSPSLHHPSEVQPGLLCAPFSSFLCLLPLHSLPSVTQPKNQVINHFSQHPVPLFQASFTFLFSILQQGHTS